MGELLNGELVCTFEKVGTFTRLMLDGKLHFKSGGDVASYVCTPDGRVIHAIPGNVEADELLAEVRWALRLYAQLREEWRPLQAELVRWAHHSRSLPQPDANDPELLWYAAVGTRPLSVHLYLAEHALEPLERARAHVWQTILGQILSDDPVSEELVPEFSDEGVTYYTSETTFELDTTDCEIPANAIPLGK